MGGIHSVTAVVGFVSLLTMYAIQTGITCKLQKVYRGRGVRLAIQLLLTVFHFITGIMCKLVSVFVQDYTIRLSEYQAMCVHIEQGLFNTIFEQHYPLVATTLTWDLILLPVQCVGTII